jgi:predicted DsbA family dithiol-disulfide isomerase
MSVPPVSPQPHTHLAFLTHLAGEVGLNEQDFQPALQTRKYQQAHQAALRHAHEDMGITAVPAFIIGGTTLTGMQRRERLEQVIEEEAKKG